MRAFIAIDIPQNIKSELTNIGKNLSEIGFECNYTSIDNLHITLMFLGECREIEANILMDILESKMNREQFEISVTKTDVFKNVKIPKIIYGDITVGVEKLEEINSLIYSHGKHILLRNKLENSFKPHITLGRIGHIEWAQIPILDRTLAGIKCQYNINVDKISLYESTLSKNGPEYKLIRTIKLDI